MLLNRFVHKRSRQQVLLSSKTHEFVSLDFLLGSVTARTAWIAGTDKHERNRLVSFVLEFRWSGLASRALISPTVIFGTVLTVIFGRFSFGSNRHKPNHSHLHAKQPTPKIEMVSPVINNERAGQATNNNTSNDKQTEVAPTSEELGMTDLKKKDVGYKVASVLANGSEHQGLRYDPTHYAEEDEEAEMLRMLQNRDHIRYNMGI